MPRSSQAALAFTSIGPLDRLAPPAELGEAEAAIFRQTVATVAPNHFRPEDLVLLCAYARTAVLERQAAAQLATAMTPGNATIYIQVTKTLMALSVRLRIGPRSRESNSRRRAGSGTSSLSYYETMSPSSDEDDGPGRN